jgi:hypothetical protein
MNSTASSPPVSVVVRTMGRTTLPRALDSIAAQTHKPLEIVLVDAAGSGMTMTSHRGVPVHAVGTGRPLPRPQAANAGLDAARGEWICFLDEDDEIAPQHLAQLVAVALLSGALASYSQTRLVAADGGTTRIFGGGPFDRAALLRSNYLGTAAVLFSRELLRRGCRFDESLDTLEDWDFWLQLSAHGDFAFSGQPTASWRAAEGQSGAGTAGNLDRDAMRAQRERLVAKWARRD